MDARRAGAIALAILSVALRVMAWALCALTVALCFNGVAARLDIVSVVIQITRSLPDLIAGYGLVATPFGGVFRLDFALTAAALLILSHVCGRLSRRLR